HAKSREGKAQVELAQLEYLLPRLRGWGESMSRQAGGRVAGGEGIGSRGPGETKVELDRRRIRTRMAKLRKQIAGMAPSRETKRSRRESSALPQVAIVGYTNAGKSSLLNQMTGADVMVQNQLFATLDPTVRRASAPDGREYTIADTVGFVRSLPHELIEAFRSTLEEAAESDLIVHVVDAAHPDPEGQIKAVHEVLEGIEGTGDIPELLVLNKSDIAPLTTLQALRTAHPRAVTVSAHTGAGVDELEQLIQEMLPRPQVIVDVVVPYSRGDLVSRMHTVGQIDSEDHLAEGAHIVGRADPDLAAELARAGVA
ncbi:MAG: GTPase HflX, partial [Ruaniaceae bacterium]|nr:GTPase HflX [Ruaniaceae bacterium]